MNESILSLEPSAVFSYFAEISSIPHGSGNTGAITDYCVAFAKNNGLKYKTDELGNVIIFKPASDDRKEKSPVILQAHLDMVCEKAPGKIIDFKAEGITVKYDGDYIFADGTSLGADDGIGVALILVVLADKSLSHPPIEAVFTIDEETGMAGAYALDCSLLSAVRMINLDSEDEGIFVVSCAGGVRVDMRIPVKHRIEDTARTLNINISGLLGGHSGSDINDGRANAIILMIDFLQYLSEETDFSIATIEAGQKDNVIPASSLAVITADDIDAVRNAAERFTADTKKAYPKETGLKIDITDSGSLSVSVLGEKDKTVVLGLLKKCPNGVIGMSKVMRGLVETSLNLGRIRLGSDELKMTYLIRSSDNAQKIALTSLLEKSVIKCGGKITLKGNYPAWEYSENSALAKTMSGCYEKLYGKSPKIAAIHAGLECGIFYSEIPGLDCVSIGPETRNIHSPAEKLSISSVRRTYELLKSILTELN